MALKKEIAKISEIAVEHYIPKAKKDPVPVLFCHGTGGGSWIWSNFCEYFSERGWDTYAMNYRGHYISEPVEDLGSCHFMDYVDDVEKVIKFLGKDPYLFGHSLGGIIVQKYAEKRNPAKLFLIDSGTSKAITEKIDREAVLQWMVEKKLFEEKGNLIRITRDIEKIRKFNFEDVPVDEEVLKEYAEKDGWESKQVALESGQISVDAEKIKCPVYVIGKKKGFSSGMPTNIWLAEYYHAKDVKTFEPMGHCFMKEKNWKTYAEIIEGWLRK